MKIKVSQFFLQQMISFKPSFVFPDLYDTLPAKAENLLQCNFETAILNLHGIFIQGLLGSESRNLSNDH
jgi:hypothetical protein